MNENLSQMVKDTTPNEGMVFSETDLDLPVEETVAEIPQEAVAETPAEETRENVVPITELASWFEANSDGLTNINQVKVSIRGVDASKTLIMAVKDGDEKDADGHDKRVLRVFDNADTMPILGLPALSMDIYNNGFKVVHSYPGNIFIKAYGIRTGLICTLCSQINGKLIPYAVVRAKRKDTELELIPTPDATVIAQKLAAAANLESVQLLYKQATKATESMTTNQSVVDWLLDRQETVTDINHHLQIDNVIIDILK